MLVHPGFNHFNVVISFLLSITTTLQWAEQDIRPAMSRRRQPPLLPDLHGEQPHNDHLHNSFPTAHRNPFTETKGGPWLAEQPTRNLPPTTGEKGIQERQFPKAMELSLGIHNPCSRRQRNRLHAVGDGCHIPALFTVDHH